MPDEQAEVVVVSNDTNEALEEKFGVKLSCKLQATMRHYAATTAPKRGPVTVYQGIVKDGKLTIVSEADAEFEVEVACALLLCDSLRVEYLRVDLKAATVKFDKFAGDVKNGMHGEFAVERGQLLAQRAHGRRGQLRCNVGVLITEGSLTIGLGANGIKLRLVDVEAWVTRQDKEKFTLQRLAGAAELNFAVGGVKVENRLLVSFASAERKYSSGEPRCARRDALLADLDRECGQFLRTCAIAALGEIDEEGKDLMVDLEKMVAGNVKEFDATPKAAISDSSGDAAAPAPLPLTQASTDALDLDEALHNLGFHTSRENDADKILYRRECAKTAKGNNILVLQSQSDLRFNNIEHMTTELPVLGSDSCNFVERLQAGGNDDAASVSVKIHVVMQRSDNKWNLLSVSVVAKASIDLQKIAPGTFPHAKQVTGDLEFHQWGDEWSLLVAAAYGGDNLEGQVAMRGKKGESPTIEGARIAAKID